MHRLSIAEAPIGRCFRRRRIVDPKIDIQIADAFGCCVGTIRFECIYGGWRSRVIRHDARHIVASLAKRYIKALE
jgi:hypothetical protein